METLDGVWTTPNIATRSLATETFSPEPDGAEERDQVAANGGVIGCRDAAEEVDHIVVGLAVEAHVAEKDDDVAVHVSVVVDVAEKAHSIVHGGVGSDFNVVEELNRVLVGVGRRGGKRQCGAEKTMGEESALHRRNIPSQCEYTPTSSRKFPRSRIALKY